MRSALSLAASKRLSEEELPIKRLWAYREKLSAAVDETRWDEAESLARAIMKDIKPAMDRSTCGVGKPHLDGLYTIGTMRYGSAPPKTRRLLNRMNRILRTAKRNVPAK